MDRSGIGRDMGRKRTEANAMDTGKTRNRARSRRRILALVLVLAVAGAGTWVILERRNRLPEVRVGVVSRGDIVSRMMVTAEIRPRETQQAFVTSQRIEAFHVEVGDRVRKGDLLVTFDNSLLEEAAADATDARETAEAAAEQARSGLEAAEKARAARERELDNQVDDLQASVAALQAEIARLSETVSGLLDDLPLPDDGGGDGGGAEDPADNPSSPILEALGVTLGELGDTISVLVGVIAGSGLSQTLDPTLQLQAVVTQAEALATQARAGETQALEALDKAVPEIRAEMDGIVVEVNTSAKETMDNLVTAGCTVGDTSGLDLSALLGQYGGSSLSGLAGLGNLSGSSLSGSQAPVPLVRILSDQDLVAAFKANRYDAVRIREGQEVQYTQEGKAYSGTVVRKGLVAVSSASTSGVEPMLDIEMSLGGEDLSALIMGFTIDAEIVVAQSENVLKIPAEALKRERDQYFVFVLDDEGVLSRRNLAPGIQSDAEAEILSGLVEGERIVLNPSNSLADGQRVRERP